MIVIIENKISLPLFASVPPCFCSSFFGSFFGSLLGRCPGYDCAWEGQVGRPKPKTHYAAVRHRPPNTGRLRDGDDEDAQSWSWCLWPWLSLSSCDHHHCHQDLSIIIHFEQFWILSWFGLHGLKVAFDMMIFVSSTDQWTLGTPDKEAEENGKGLPIRFSSPSKRMLSFQLATRGWIFKSLNFFAFKSIEYWGKADYVVHDHKDDFAPG